MEQQKPTYQRRILKWGVIIIIPLLLVFAGRQVLKSSWLFDIVRDIAISQVNEQIKGVLEIESIRGDLLNGFTVTHIIVRDEEGETVASINSAEISYNVRSLIRSPYRIERLSVTGTDLFLEQYQDSTWNVLNIVETADTSDEESTLFWAIDDVEVRNTNIEVQSPILLPDEFLFIDSLETKLSAGILETGFFGDLEQLDFNLRESRLPKSIAVYLEGNANNERYTLESLIINTGQTALSASGFAIPKGSLSGDVQIDPLSVEDIMAYSGGLPLQQNLSVQLTASGSLDQPTISLQATAEGLERFETSAILDFRDEPAITGLTLGVSGLNGPLLTGMNETPTLASFDVNGSGSILFSQPELANWDMEFTVENVQYDSYQIDQIVSSLEYDNESIDSEMELLYQNENIYVNVAVRNLFDEIPIWNAEMESNQLNLATWLHNPELQSHLNLLVKADGVGISSETLTANVQTDIRGKNFNEQPFSSITFDGDINTTEITGVLHARIEESRLETNFSISDWMDTVPRYTFSASLNELNMEELNGLESFPTYINGTLKGQGLGSSPENLYVVASAVFDSSIVNNEIVEALNADFIIEDQFFTVDNAQLESPIASGIFSLKQHLTEFTNLQNQAEFQATIKDLQPLAPLLGFDIFRMSGEIDGNILRSGSNGLVFNSNFDFVDIKADTLFRAGEVTGTFSSTVKEDPETELFVQISESFIYETSLQNVEIIGTSIIQDSLVRGAVQLNFSNEDQSSLMHSGEYLYTPEDIVLITEELEFTTPVRTLTLTEPFEARYANNSVKMDTMKVSQYEDEAYLQFWISHLDSTQQDLGMDAKNLNLGELQRTVLNDSYVDGYLSGYITVNNTSDQLSVNASGLLDELMMEEGRMDSVRFDAIIENEWLSSDISAWNSGRKLMETSLRVPFLPGDPKTFDEQFFEREVEGIFTLYDSEISYWLDFLPESTVEQTSGVVSMHGELDGIAGNPQILGGLSVSDATFSGIAVDYFGIGAQYIHDEARASLEGSVIKDSNSILSFNSNLPMLVDLKQAEIILPSGSDSLRVVVETDDFNLALFNSYVDEEVMSNLSGVVDGAITLFGTVDHMKTEGNLKVIDGSVRAVPAGITLNEMNASIRFEPERISVEQFSVRSGPGQLKANGFVDVEDLQPGRLNFDITGNQFRAVNTSEYNALVNLSTSLTGTLNDPVLDGNLTFLNGQINLQNFGDRTVEEVVLEGESEEEPFDYMEALAIEMNVDFGDQFMIQNRQYLDMELLMGGVVDVVKVKNEELQLFGTLEGIQGYARPVGKNFQLDEATISFSGQVDNPDLNVVTYYEPPQAAGVRILYIIEGTLENPEFRFDSEPELELQDIISYTLFGKPFYELESWEQVVAGSGSSPSASDYALDVLLDRVEMLASQKLGIDVVQIDNTRSGSNSTTSIKTGWYLNQRTFFAILNEVGGARPKTLFILEYLLRDNLELIITQGDDSREGIDLRWNLDY